MGGVYLIFFISGLFTVCPTIYWRDSSEFVTVVQNLGIPHPAGSPTYALLAKGLTFFPIGNLALRVNMISVFGYAISLSLLFFLSYQMIQLFFPLLSQNLSKWLSLLICLNFGWSPGFWLSASFAEVYTISSAVILGILTFGFYYWKSRDIRYIYAGAFLYGLASGVHATVAFFLPAMLFLFLSCTPKNKWIPHFLSLSFFFLWGFSVYLYLPIRSLANPTYDWGNPETLSQFLIHITDRKTQTKHFSYDLTTSLSSHIPRYLGHLLNEIGIVGLLASFIGAIVHFLKAKKLFFFLILFYLGNVIFFLDWKTADGIIPSNIVLSLWAALGFSFVFQHIEKIKIKWFEEVRWERVLVLILFLIIFFKSFIPSPIREISAFEVANKSHFFNAYRTARNEYNQLSDHSMVLTTLFWFPFRYFQDIEHYRENISVLMASDIVSPNYFNPITQSRFPNIKVPALNPLQVPWYEYMPELINLNILERDIFYEPSITLTRPIYQNLQPNLFIFKVTTEKKDQGIKKEKIKKYMEDIRSLIANEYFYHSFDNDYNSREYYMTFLLFNSHYLILHGYPYEANVLLKLANEIRPHQGMVQFYMAQTELALGDSYGSFDRLRRLIKKEPSFFDPQMVLIKQSLKYGDLQDLDKRMATIPKNKMEDFKVNLFFLEYYWRKGEFGKAKKYLNLAFKGAKWEEEQIKAKQWEIVLNDVLAYQ